MNVSALSRLPVELVVEVFFGTLPSSLTWRVDVRHQARCLLRLRLVSKSWNAIVEGTPKFWTSLDSSCPSEWTSLALTRSKSHPLHLRISSAPSHPSTKLFLDILMPFVHRWQSFASLTSLVRDDLANAEAPLLRILEYASWDLSPQTLRLFQGGTPQLRQMDIRADAIDLKSKLFCSRSIQRLNLSVATKLDIGELWDFLGRVQGSLAEFALDCDSDSETAPIGNIVLPSSLTPLLLPNLTDLDLDCLPPIVIVRLLTALQTPSLTRSSIECDVGLREVSTCAQVILTSFNFATTWTRVRLDIYASDCKLKITSSDKMDCPSVRYTFYAEEMEDIFRALTDMEATLSQETDIRLHWTVDVSRRGDNSPLALTWSAITRWIGPYVRSIIFAEGDVRQIFAVNAYYAILQMVADREMFPKLEEVIVPYIKDDSDEIMGLVGGLEDLEPPATLVLYEGSDEFDSDIETLDNTNAYVRTVGRGEEV